MEARRLGHHYLGAEHLLVGLLLHGDNLAARVLVAEGAFVIDQTVTVAFAGLEQQRAAPIAELAQVLNRYGGTAGLLREEAGPLSCWRAWTP
jgi:ATP-dependent Clp protease ATP-binding subunit ClpC